MSSFKLNQNGYWEKEGKMFAYLAKIKADKCLKNEDIRKNFQPNSMVEYSLDKIYREDFDGEDIYLASVTKYESENKNVYPIPLCMLELSKKQIDEIVRIKHYPKKAFEKNGVLKDRIEENSFVHVGFLEDDLL